MERIKKEKSILGRISDLSHRLVFMLVIPIIMSLVFMLVYASKYHNAILRMETITSLKTVVTEDIPGSAWNIVSGRETFPESRIYEKINNVDETIEMITQSTGAENRLSLVVAGRTMQTLRNYVDRIRDNIDDEVPVVENEEVLTEVRDVAALVDSMLNDYIEQEIRSAARMSGSLRLGIIITAVCEALIVILAMWIRNRSVIATEMSIRQPIERLEEVAAKIAEGSLDARIADTEVTELRNLTSQVNVSCCNVSIGGHRHLTDSCRTNLIKDNLIIIRFNLRRIDSESTYLQVLALDFAIFKHGSSLRAIVDIYLRGCKCHTVLIDGDTSITNSLNDTCGSLLIQ